MDIVIIEKREKIGEVRNVPIQEWKFFDAVLHTKIKDWCRNQGLPVPKFGWNSYEDLGDNFRCFLWEI